MAAFSQQAQPDISGHEAELLLRSLVTPSFERRVVCMALVAAGALSLIFGFAQNMIALAASGGLCLCAGLVACLLTYARPLWMRRSINRLHELDCVAEAARQFAGEVRLKQKLGRRNLPCQYTKDFLFVPGNGVLLRLSDIRECFVQLSDNVAGHKKTMVNVILFSDARVPLGAVDANTFLSNALPHNQQLKLTINGKQVPTA